MLETLLPDQAPAPRPGWPSSLALRMGVGLCLGAAAILFVAGAWNLHLERTHLTHLVGVSAERIAETIRRSTREAMLRNDSEGLHRVIENIGAQKGLVRIRIFNKQGRIRTSTRASEVGTLVDIRAEQCYACHQRDRPLDRLARGDRVRLFESPEGHKILGVIAPIYNEPQCTGACHAHPPSQHVLGVLDVQLSMESVDQALTVSERQWFGALVATVAAVLALAGLLLWRMVLRPVADLSSAMGRVAAGDLSSRVPVSSSDEIGALARSWNVMTAELVRARGELEEWNRTLERRVKNKTAQLEQAHQRMLLVERMASLGRLAAVVAHEINNPLAGIRTYARLLRRKAQDIDPEGERILRVVEEEAARCGEIVRNMLLFSRSSNARFAKEDVRVILERCRLLLHHQAKLLDVHLSVEAGDDLPRLFCDASQIQQMILALGMNAIEATPAQGQVKIAARTGAGDHEVTLTISDTGSGIATQDQEHMFEPFFTTKEEGQGVGLGLTVVYGIVERHHAHIEVDSRLGRGTLFTVRLPIEPPEDQQTAAERETHER